MTVEEWLGKDNQLGIDIWHKKYQFNDETFEDWLIRVSGGNEEVKELIRQKKFLFGGRALSNRGTNRNSSMFNCYSSGYVEDNVKDIMQLNTNLALTYKAQGGQGISLSKIRPQGSPIGKDYVSDGIVPFMELFNATTATISQGGARKGALMMSIDIRHKEAATFITIKTNADKITNANLSLEIDDDFMNAVKKYYESGETIILHESRMYENHKVEYDVIPIELYKLMVETVYDWGEPGCIFTNRFRNYNLMEKDEDYNIITCNPCLTGDTMIAVADGRNAVSIKDLCNTNFTIYSGYWNKRKFNTTGDGWVAEIKPAKAFKTGYKKIITVVLSDGTEFRCTPDHRLGLVDGTYLEAQACLGKQLGKFYTFSNKNNNKNYRCINSKTSNRQYKLIAEYNGLAEPGKQIHHVDGIATNDYLVNLKAITEEEHKLETAEQRRNNNPISRDSNYKFNQGLRSISANGKRYDWSDEKIAEAKEQYKLTHEYVAVEDKNVDFTAAVYVVDIIDEDIYEDVYDITVEDNHNFYIITKTDDNRYLNCSGILVHNCGEQPLPKNFACNLGSLNLSEFVISPYTDNAKFDYDEFRRAVKLGVDALDDIIEENAEKHALKEQKQNSLNYRNMGLGVFGYANMLFELGLTYGSRKAKNITEKIFREMFIEALKESNALAKEKGAFPKCKKEALINSTIFKTLADNSSVSLDDLKQNIEKYGLRNCSLISIAPTGSIATMMQCSGGCEPEFALSYTRRTINLNDSYKVYCKSVKGYCKVNNIELNDTTELPSYFITSEQLNWRERVETQAIMQKYVDTAISSTINLAEDTSKDEVEKIYLYAWEQGLKGLTLFRSNCKRLAILSAVKPEKQEVQTTDDIGKEGFHSVKWGTVLPVRTDLDGMKTRIYNGCGDFHFQLFYDELTGRPWETFINMGGHGGCERNLENISKFISKCLRAGVDIKDVIETLKQTRPCASFISKRLKGEQVSEGTSCPSAMGFALESFMKKINEKHRDCPIVNTEVKTEVKQEAKKVVDLHDGICPECGAELEHSGGCDVCKECGYSHCG